MLNFSGIRNPFYGKHHTEETKRRHSEYMKGKQSGKNHPSWKGGQNHRFWSKSVKERDNYICKVCGNKDKRVLQADHIKSKKLYPELAFDISNGITLCANCHVIKTYYEDKELINSKSRKAKNQWVKWRLEKKLGLIKE